MKSPLALVFSTVLGAATCCLSEPLGCRNETNTTASTNPAITLEISQKEGLWNTTVGRGFRRGATHYGFEIGAGPGVSHFGSQQAHDLAVGKLQAGLMLSRPLWEDHWYGGNLELLGELFGGRQFHPEDAYLFGITPVLRYNFTTGTRLVPFLDAGAGLTVTDIGEPDLSTKFQFNDQAGAGVHWFMDDHSTVTVSCRWVHISNAGIEEPNLGTNSLLFFAGMSWFF